MTPFDFLTYVLATWYLSYILTAQNGPFLLLQRIRGVSYLSGVLSCIYCVAPYVAGVVYLIGKHQKIGQPLIQIIAVAGAALMLRAYTGAGMHDTT